MLRAIFFHIQALFIPKSIFKPDYFIFHTMLIISFSIFINLAENGINKIYLKLEYIENTQLLLKLLWLS